MVYSSGLEAATQRIREIREHLTALDKKPLEQMNPAEATESFESILHEKIDDGTPVTPSGGPSDIQSLIEEHAEKLGLDSNLVKAVAKAESGFNPNAISKAGAKGIMQLMPSTAKALGVRSILDPSDNIAGGTKYLKSLMDKYHSVPLAVAAYNAGPGAVDRFGGVPPYKETQTYVQRVLNYQQQFDAEGAE